MPKIATFLALSLLALLACSGSLFWLGRATTVAALPLHVVTTPRITDIMRPSPLCLRSRGGLAKRIALTDLQDILKFLEPHWEIHDASTVLHGLRLWGPHTEFAARPVFPVTDRTRAMGGPEMLRYFLEEKEFQKRFNSPSPLFFKSAFGLGANRGFDTSDLAHRDDFLAVAGEISLPLETRLQWGDTVSTLRDALAHSLHFFTLGQEMEFTAVAYAYYLQPGSAWPNRFGEDFTFDSIANRLVSQSPKDGACDGTHVPFALAILWAANEQVHLLSEETREQIEVRLRQFSTDLAQSQGAGGWWDRKWTKERAYIQRNEPELEEWVRNTGHHLEWMAFVPPDLRPPEECISRAVRFLIPVLKRPKIGGLPGGENFNSCSHAARALLLLSDHGSSAEVMKEPWQQRMKVATKNRPGKAFEAKPKLPSSD
jgi:hypothetical protein